MAPKRTREEQYIYDITKKAFQDDEFDDFLAELMEFVYPTQVSKRSKTGDKGEYEDASSSVPGTGTNQRNNGNDDDDSRQSSSSE